MILFLFYVNLQLLKINYISNNNILINFNFNFNFLNFSFLSFSKVLFIKNNILLVYMVIILNISFLMIINKYKLYINGIIKKISL